MKSLRVLLFPFSLVYGLVVLIRNWCYDLGLFKSQEFNIPIISVGNLEVGGAGKSPMTEYLIRLFIADYNIATISRGYGRSTKGFVEATAETNVNDIGDEPAQFKCKFPEITVAVCEKRVEGINRLIPAHNLILMDDAYQHRAVKPGLSILLSDYNRLTRPHLLLPAGNLREPFYGRKRAQIIIISKCPENLSADQQAKAKQFIKPLAGQALYFTTIAYLPLQDNHQKEANAVINQDTKIFLLTGIANPSPLIQHLKKQTEHISHHNYPDHHRFSLENISKLAADYEACPTQNKLIITTEKDAQRLTASELQAVANKLPYLVLPIGTSFLNNGQQQFDQHVNNYVREHTNHH